MEYLVGKVVLSSKGPCLIQSLDFGKKIEVGLLKLKGVSFCLILGEHCF